MWILICSWRIYSEYVFISWHHDEPCSLYIFVRKWANFVHMSCVSVWSNLVYPVLTWMLVTVVILTHWVLKAGKVARTWIGRYRHHFVNNDIIFSPSLFDMCIYACTLNRCKFGHMLYAICAKLTPIIPPPTHPSLFIEHMVVLELWVMFCVCVCVS